MRRWIRVCGVDDVEPEDVIRADCEGRVLAIYRSPEGRFYATDGLCTHERVPLSDGLVMDHVIECPKHNGRFDYTTGKGMGAPICVDLATYPTQVQGGEVFVELADA